MLAVFLNFSVIRLSMEAVEGSVKSIDFDDEAVNVFLREQVTVIMNGVHVILMVNLVALHLFIAMRVPLATGLGRRSNNSGMDQVGPLLWLLRLALAEHKLKCLVWLFACLKQGFTPPMLAGVLVGAQQLARVAGPQTWFLLCFWRAQACLMRRCLG